MGNGIGSGLAISVIYVCPLDGLETLSVILFLYFNLNQKGIELNNVGHIDFFFELFLFIKTCILNHSVM